MADYEKQKKSNLKYDEALEATLRILLVDDYPQIRESISNVLVAEGHEVIEAVNTEDALEKISNAHTFDVIISDYNMPPGKNGSEIYFQLKKRGLRIPFILFSGNILGIPKEEFNKMDELYAFLDKPNGIAALVSYIQDIQIEKTEKSGFFHGDK